MITSEPEVGWMNGHWAAIDLPFLYDFIHDLPEPIDEIDVTKWLDLLRYGESGGSAWSYELTTELYAIKAAILGNHVRGIEAAIHVDMHGINSLSRALNAIDWMIKLALNTTVSCWTVNNQYQSLIQSKFEAVSRSNLDSLQELPHFQLAQMRANDKRRSLQKIVRQYEARLNKLLKNKGFRKF